VEFGESGGAAEKTSLEKNQGGGISDELFQRKTLPAKKVLVPTRDEFWENGFVRWKKG